MPTLLNDSLNDVPTWDAVPNLEKTPYLPMAELRSSDKVISMPKFRSYAKPLRPEEIPEPLRHIFDFSSQRQGKPHIEIIRKCLTCGEGKWVIVSVVRKLMRRYDYTGKCIRCAGIRRREESPSWRGGFMKKGGYMRILMRGHPYGDSDGYVAEHRYVVEQHIGRYLTPIETVHHINGNRLDNRSENLELRVGNHGSGARYSDLTSDEIVSLISYLSGLLELKPIQEVA